MWEVIAAVVVIVLLLVLPVPDNPYDDLPPSLR